MSFDVAFIIEKFPYVLTGFKMTLFLSITSILVSLLIGIVGAVLRSMNVPLLSRVISLLVQFIRNTPLLVQMFFVYFGLPSVGLTLSAPVTGIIALSIWGGAYAIENFRGGFDSVSKQLVDSGYSLGFNKFHVYRYIIIPIGFRISFASYSNTAISIVKNSSLLAGIGLVELTFTAIDTVSIYFKTFEMFLTIGAIYLILIWLLSYVFGIIEKKLGVQV